LKRLVILGQYIFCKKITHFGTEGVSFSLFRLYRRLAVNTNKNSGTNNNDNQTKQSKQINIHPRTNLELMYTTNSHNQSKEQDKESRGTNTPRLFTQPN
jgi:hypothetical protein